VELTDELKRHIERRVHFGFGRFATRIRSLTIRLKDSNGPRGGVDQCCDVEVDVGLPQPVVVRERQASMFSAVALAVERAGQAVRRRLVITHNRPEFGTR